MSFNHGKTSKAGDKPPADKAERTTSGRPTSLKEISHLGWREWDGHMVDLKGYFRDHFQDMSSICPDPMKATGPAPAYIVYRARSIPVGAFQDIDLATTEGMAEKELRMAAYKDSITLANRKMDKQDQEKGTAYEIIRSMCSASLNIILTSDKEFTEMTSNDPLQLLNILKRLITSKVDGHVEHDRSDALEEWYTLRMRDGEDVAMYSKRAAKAIERMVATKVEKTRIPTDVQQAFGYIKGLNSKVAVYEEYKNYLSNAMVTMKLDKYPVTMAEAIQGVARFHRGATYEATTAPTVHTTFVAEEEPRKPEGAPRRFAGNCNYCGRSGHKEKDCRSKAARQEHVAKMAQGSIAETAYHSTFGSMYGDGDVSQGRQGHHGCITVQVSNGGRRTSATEAIFDTGATGTIIAWRGVLSDIRDTQPMVFKGLSGDLEVTQKGMLKGIGRVYYDSRAIMSIISASECTRQGHEWEFQRDIVRG
jgi:hypothetical protein